MQQSKEMALNQQALKQIQDQLLSQQFDGKFQEALKKEFFPKEDLTEVWLTSAEMALLYTSPLALGIPASDFRELYTALEKREITLLQFSILSNNLEIRTQNELGIRGEGYLMMMEQAYEMAMKWRAITDPMRKEVADAIRNSLNIKQAPAGKFNERPTGMGAVKAEA